MIERSVGALLPKYDGRCYAKDMHVVRYRSPTEFANQVVPFLMGEEAKNTLQIGLCLQLASGQSHYKNPYMACVFEGDRLVAVALMTPPHSLTVGDLDEEVAACIAKDLAASPWTTNGVNGPKESAECFAKTWTRTRGLDWHAVFQQRLYKLTSVVVPDLVAGELALCTDEDLDRVVRWWTAFVDEVHPGGPTTGNEKRTRRLAQKIQDSELFFWKLKDEPLTLIGITGHSLHGARIGPVYTPPEMRRQGYGAAATAALSERLLEGGKDFCCLFTDLANPVSNSIYQKIGYRPVADAAQIEFSTP